MERLLPLDSVIHGDSLEILATFPDNSIDALCCDPPSGISFMGATWDSHKGGRTQWVAWLTEIMQEVYRVLKPGAHGFVWALPKTSHWTAWAIEEAGFDIKECFYHLFASGMPKGLNVSKAIDKYLGAEREIVGPGRYAGRGRRVDNIVYSPAQQSNREVETLPATPEAQQWDDWHSEVKPAAECWWLIQKPLAEKTITKNVLVWGTGALNIGACRVGTAADMNPRDFDDSRRTAPKYSGVLNGGREGKFRSSSGTVPNGRFPSNILFSHSLFCTEDQCEPTCAVQLLNQQQQKASQFYPVFPAITFEEEQEFPLLTPFLFIPKPSTREKEEGCELLPKRASGAFDDDTYREPGVRKSDHTAPQPRGNTHPTIKSLALMRWLTRLITPPEGIVLDCFAGSGSTLVACLYEGLHFVGIEKNNSEDEPFVAICESRLAYHRQKLAN